MRQMIRYAVAVLPMGLILSGCVGPQRTDAFSFLASPRLAGLVPLVDDRRNEPSVNLPAASTAADRKHDITLEQIRRHVRDKTAVIMDARSPKQFASGHVHGSINVPAAEIESYMPGIEQSVGRDRLIIIYCDGPTCGSGDTVYEYLADRGFINLRVYSPGWRTLASAEILP